jgi:hypothetical protein
MPGLNTSLITWWEQPPNAVAGIRDVLRGRTFTGEQLVHIGFADGSNLLLRKQHHTRRQEVTGRFPCCGTTEA